ncbi:MAG: PAP/fibrillin family protein, partial [Cyanobacteria bacterium P01_A01_bin.68]
FMQQHSRIYQIIQQLEEINPNPQPLTSKNLSKLVGDWKVLYSIKRHRTPLGTQTVSNKGT